MAYEVQKLEKGKSEQWSVTMLVSLDMGKKARKTNSLLRFVSVSVAKTQTCNLKVISLKKSMHQIHSYIVTILYKSTASFYIYGTGR